MSDNSNPNRLNDAALDADLSVLGDDGVKPGVPRLGDAPAPGVDGPGNAATGSQASADATGTGQPGGGSAVTGERAAKESIRDVVEDQGKR